MKFFIGFIFFFLRLKFSTTEDLLNEPFIIEYKFDVSKLRIDNENTTFLINKTPKELNNLCLSLKNAMIFSSYEKFDDFFESFVNIDHLETSINLTYGFELISLPNFSGQIIFFCKFNEIIIHLITFSSVDYYMVNMNTKHTEQGVIENSSTKGEGLGVFVKPLEMQVQVEGDFLTDFYETFSKICIVTKQDKNFLKRDIQTLKLGASSFLKLFGFKTDRKVKIVVSPAKITAHNSGKKGKLRLNLCVTNFPDHVRHIVTCYANCGNITKKIYIPVLRYNIYNEKQQITEFFIARNPFKKAEIFVLNLISKIIFISKLIII